MSDNTPAVIDAEFAVVRAHDAPSEDAVMGIVQRWMQRSHGVDREDLLASMPHLDRYAFTNTLKRAIAAAALELVGEIELARKVAA